jgi:signal transduction histidine kinase
MIESRSFREFVSSAIGRSETKRARQRQTLPPRREAGQRPAVAPASVITHTRGIRRSRDPGVALSWLSLGAAWTAFTVGSLVLIGWATGIEVLRGVITGSTVMLPYTALCFGIGGISLLLLRVRPTSRASLRGDDGSGKIASHGKPVTTSEAPSSIWGLRVAGALALVLTVVGIMMLAQRISGRELGINLLLFPNELSEYPFRPLGLMAVNSALSFVLLGLALLAIAIDSHRGAKEAGARSRSRAVDYSQLLGALVLLIALTALIGYAYGVQALYSFDRASGMALSTALTFMMLSLGVLAARPNHGMTALIASRDAAGVMARPLLAAAVLVPFGLGLVWLAARRASFVTREGGVSLFVVLAIVTFVVLVLRSASVVQRTGRAREQARASADRARVSAEAANRAKSDFLTVMSHELRTPLNAIAGYTQLLEMGLHGPITDAQRDALARIDRSHRYLLRLINDVLNFARVESGRVEYELRPLLLAEVVRDVEPMIESQLAAKQLAYSVALAPGLRVRADREKLQQILLNLLSNAVKFTPSGGEVSVESVDRVDGGEDEGMVYLRVRDSGIGIPRDRLETVFEPFVQVDTSLTRRQEGVGLGLAISRDVARGMGGDLRARSEPGKGSTFTLALPLA